MPVRVCNYEQNDQKGLFRFMGDESMSPARKQIDRARCALSREIY